ncbi:MAG: hypothetical protein WD696_07625 [Bryobacteraceae bacterium]
MNRWSVCLLAVAAHGLAQEGKVAEPVLAEFMDLRSGGVVRVLGSPGSSVLAGPVPLAPAGLRGADSPREGLLAGVDENGVFSVWDYRKRLVSRPAVPDNPDSVVISASGRAIAIAYYPSREITVLTWRGERPIVHRVHPWPAPERFRLAAVSGDAGRVLAIAESDSGSRAWLLSDDREPVPIREVAAGAVAAFLPGADGFVFADPGTREVLSCSSSTLACKVILDSSAGLERPSAVAADSTKRVFVADSALRQIFFIDAETGEGGRLECPAQPTQLVPLGPALFLAATPDSDTVMLLDSGSDTPRVVSAVWASSEGVQP